MTDKSTLIEFPCNFTLKIIGASSDDFVERVSTVVLKHFPETLASNLVPKQSEKGNYTAISATVYAQNKPSLDALYSDLTQLPDIKMVL